MRKNKIFCPRIYLQEEIDLIKDRLFSKEELIKTTERDIIRLKRDIRKIEERIKNNSSLPIYGNKNKKNKYTLFRNKQPICNVYGIKNARQLFNLIQKQEELEYRIGENLYLITREGFEYTLRNNKGDLII